LSAGSKDPDGTIVQYYWSILSTGQFSNKANLSVNFPRSGNYTAMLTVTDDNGNTASASISVQIRNRAPKATISAPCSIQAGKLAQFNASGSNDTDGTIVSFSWNFGDNFTSSEKVATHTYINPGTYKVTLTVMDNEKSLGTATWNITVLKKPSVPVKNTTADSGIWVFGLCVAVLLVFVIYISAPGRSKPRKKGTLMHKPKKPRTRKKKSS
jgi:chitinase